MRWRFLALALLLLLALAPLAASRAAEEQDFAAWLQGVRAEALAAGISAGVVDRAFADLSPLARVIELDRKQPETRIGFEEYLERVVSRERRAEARRKFSENRALLRKIERRYHVQARFIVALWGIETNFGQLTGGFPVIAALATLAYDGRRSAFFRAELLNALRIAEQDHLDPREMRGSWAGAMGQSQFMPSTFLKYAVSYGADGRRDIWHRREDVFASIANYLTNLGWRADETWGRAVRLPARLDPKLIGYGEPKTLAEWAKLGLRRSDGGPLPRRAVKAWLVQPGGEGPTGELVYANFRTLLKWNNSSYFASAVGYLADSIEER